MYPIPPRSSRFAILLLGLLLLGACSRYVPVSASMEASPARIVAGEATTLTWNLGTQPGSALLRPGVVAYEAVLEPGSVDVTGRTSLEVSPETTTTYELVVRWAAQEVRAEATVEVQPANEAPTGSDGSFVLDEDASLEVDLAPLFTDADGDTLTYSVVTGPALGAANVSGAILTYVPAANANGADSVVVEVADGATTARATLSIEVRPMNDAPAGTSDSVVVDEDGSAGVDLATLFTDVDGDALSYSIATAPALGAASISGSALTYTPTANANGTDEVIVEATDGTASATATLSIEVQPVNDAPTAAAASFTAFSDDPLEVDLSTLASDPDGDALSFRIASGPTSGTADVTGSTLTFTPAADASDADAITVEASDGALATQFVVSFVVRGSISDPAGDHSGDQDALGLRWYRDGDDVVFEFELTTAVQAFGYMSIDLDRDLATGASSAISMFCPDAPTSGYELEIDLFTGDVRSLTGAGTLGTATTAASETVTTVRFPLAWADGDSVLDPSAIVGNGGPSDCVPGGAGVLPLI